MCVERSTIALTDKNKNLMFNTSAERLSLISVMRLTDNTSRRTFEILTHKLLVYVVQWFFGKIIYKPQSYVNIFESETFR